MYHQFDIQIPATTTRILLNHFKWDKEKLMERFYDGDQDQLFSEARVINPFRKPAVVNRPKVKVCTIVLFNFTRNQVSELMQAIINFKCFINDFKMCFIIATKKNISS